jgi:TIR domain
VNPSYIFISHASKDDEFVKELHLALEAYQLPVWVDSHKLRGGAKLAPEINEANRAGAAGHRRAQLQHHQLPLGAQGDSKGAGGRTAAER